MLGRGSFSCKTQYKTFIQSITGMNPTINTSRASLSFLAISPFRYFKHKNQNYKETIPQRAGFRQFFCPVLYDTAQQTNKQTIKGCEGEQTNK